MATSDRRGMISLRALLLAVGVLGLGFLVVGPLRTWAQALFAANSERGVEFSRRVQGQRLEAVRPELTRIGIDIDDAAGSATAVESGAALLPPAGLESGWRAWAARWWRQLRGIPEPVAPVPALADSAGLRPGEQMFLPDGRVVRYDSSAFQMKREPSPTPGH